MVWWCGVLEGLTYTRRLPVRAIELYIDSLVVVNAITSDEYDSWRGRFLVEKIHHLLVLDWEVVVHHSYRKANRCANTLAIDGFKSLFIWITNINILLFNLTSEIFSDLVTQWKDFVCSRRNSTCYKARRADWDFGIFFLQIFLNYLNKDNRLI
jgi:hypothetical protein